MTKDPVNLRKQFAWRSVIQWPSHRQLFMKHDRASRGSRPWSQPASLPLFYERHWLLSPRPALPAGKWDMVRSRVNFPWLDHLSIHLSQSVTAKSWQRKTKSGELLVWQSYSVWRLLRLSESWSWTWFPGWRLVKHDHTIINNIININKHKHTHTTYLHTAYSHFNDLFLF